MKEFISKSVNLAKIEFWAATTTFVFSVFFLTANAVKSESSDVWTSSRYLFQEARIPFNYTQDYFFPQIVRYTLFYLSFLLLNFRVVPDLVKKQKLVQNILLVVLTFLIIGFVSGVTDTYLKNYIFTRYETEQEAFNYFFQNSFVLAAWMILMYGLYTVIKYTGIYLILNSETIQSKYQMVTSDGIAAFVVWMVITLLMLLTDVNEIFLYGWVIVIPIAIFIYWFSFYAYIPQNLNRKRPFWAYFGSVLWVVLISTVILAFLAFAFLGGKAVAIILFNSVFQLLITAPVSWELYKRRQKGNEEMRNLRTALGQSDANLGFLRSQINPHFLFNALNTIYGTALQEGASRTSEGVERLGDMMRFMLQENVQEKISLTREIDYLNNYIILQRLRTDTSPDVKIITDIDESVNNLQISPMLLIPFVENAFKHGISLRQPSHIKVSLHIKNSTVYFDVNNSVHVKPDNDPEKDKNGIGLENVKQRLQLLYPRKHDLMIRETAKEFFIHLTILLE